MERRPPPAPPSARDDWWWIFDPRLSLRARAALLTGGCMLGFTVLVTWLAGTMVHRSLERQTGATFETLAFQVGDKLDRVIHARQHELQLASALAPFRNGEAAPADRRRLLDAVQENARDFAWIGFADAGGTVRSATGGIFEGTAVGNRPWFLIARERAYAGGMGEQPALTRELTGSDENRPARYLDLAVPVHEAGGRFLGVLGAQVQWDWSREVQLSVIPESARRERIGVTVYSAAGDVLLDSGGSGWSQPPEPPTIPEAQKFRGTMVEPTSSGTAYITGFARSRGYRDYRGLGWLIAVRQPAALALAPARDLQRTIFGWGALLTAVLVAVSWISAGRLARRIHTIELAARRIRGGDVLTVLPLPRGEGELAQMCGALGDLVQELREKPASDRPDRTSPASAEPPSARSR